jgi:hypothetical protein
LRLSLIFNRRQIRRRVYDRRKKKIKGEWKKKKREKEQRSRR